jgi:hypothetical protein
MTFSRTASAVVVSAALAMMTCSTALGACKTTFRGELVQSQAQPPRPAFPRAFLFFSLFGTAQPNQTSAEQHFQFFAVPNAKTTFPIPFTLDIDSPKDCPGELQLVVGTDVTDHPRISFGDKTLTGVKTIRLDRFETIPVWGPFF